MVPIQTTSRKINYIKYLNLIFCDCNGGAMAPMAPLWIHHWRRIGRDATFRREGRGLESRSSRRVGTLGMSFTYSFL